MAEDTPLALLPDELDFWKAVYLQQMRSCSMTRDGHILAPAAAADSAIRSLRLRHVEVPRG